MKIQVRNLQYNVHGSIDMEMSHDSYGWIPFTASPDDVEDYGRALYSESVAGKFGDIASYIEPQTTISVPHIVTMRQARLALLDAGLLAQVDAVIDLLPSPEKEAARIEWNYSSEVHRNKPFVQSIATALAITDANLDSLFIAASEK